MPFNPIYDSQFVNGGESTFDLTTSPYKVGAVEAPIPLYTPNKDLLSGRAVGESDYDTPIDERSVTDAAFINRQRADLQPEYAKFFNATIGGIISGLATAAEDIGYTADIENGINRLTGLEEVETNFLSANAQAFKKWLYKEMPIYKEDPNKAWDWSDSGSYWEALRGVVDSAVGFAIPGTLAAKGIGATLKGAKTLGYLSKLTEPSAQIVQSIGGGFITNYGEGKMMALEMYENSINAMKQDYYKKILDNELATGVDPGVAQFNADRKFKEALASGLEDKFKQLAGHEADIFQRNNMAFIVTDAIGLHNIAKGAGFTRNLIPTRKGLTALTELSTDNLILQGAKEGAEEIGQNIMQSEREWAAKTNAKLDTGDPVDFGERILKYATSDKALIEGAMGFLGGGVQRVMMKGLTGQYGSGYNQNLQDRIQKQNEQIQANTSFLQQKLSDVKTANELLAEAIKKGDTSAENYIKTSATHSIIMDNLQRGTIENLERQIDDMMEQSTDPTQKEQLQKVRSEIPALEKMYLKYSGYVNSDEVFQNRLNEKALSNRVKDLTQQESILRNDFTQAARSIVEEHNKLNEDNPINLDLSEDAFNTKQFVNNKEVNKQLVQLGNEYYQAAQLKDLHVDKVNELNTKYATITSPEYQAKIYEAAKEVGTKLKEAQKKQEEAKKAKESETKKNERLAKAKAKQEATKPKETTIKQEEPALSKEAAQGFDFEDETVEVIEDTSKQPVSKWGALVSNAVSERELDAITDQATNADEYTPTLTDAIFKKRQELKLADVEKRKGALIMDSFKKWDDFEVDKGTELFERDATTGAYKSLGKIEEFKVGKNGQTLEAVKVGNKWLNNGSWIDTYTQTDISNELEALKAERDEILKLSKSETQESSTQEHIEDTVTSNFTSGSEDEVDSELKTIDNDVTKENGEVSGVDGNTVTYEYDRVVTGYNIFAYLSRLYQQIFKGNSLQRVDIDNYINENMVDKSILSPNKFKVGTKITIKLDDVPTKIYIPGTKEEVEWNKYVESKGDSFIGSQEYWDLVPMAIYDESGKKIAHLHSLDWINPSNVAGDIEENKKELTKLRKEVSKNGKYDTTIAEKKIGKLFKTSDKKPIKLGKAMPKPILAIVRNGKLTTSRGKEFIGTLANKSLKEGGLYAIVQMGDKSLGIPLIHDKLSTNPNIIQSIVDVVKIFVTNDKANPLVKSINANMGINILTKEGMESYLKAFVNIYNTGGKDLDKFDLKNISSDKYILTINNGTVDFARGMMASTRAFINKGTNGKLLEANLKLLSKHLANMYFNADLDMLENAENKKIVVYDSNGSIVTDSYMNHLKNVTNTNVLSVNIGTEESPEYTSFIQPIIRFKSDIKDEVKPVESAKVETTNGSAKDMDLKTAKTLSKVYADLASPKTRTTSEMLLELAKFLNTNFNWGITNLTFSSSDKLLNFSIKEKTFSIPAVVGIMGGNGHYIGNTLEQIVEAKHTVDTESTESTSTSKSNTTEPTSTIQEEFKKAGFNVDGTVDMVVEIADAKRLLKKERVLYNRLPTTKNKIRVVVAERYLEALEKNKTFDEAFEAVQKNYYDNQPIVNETIPDSVEYAKEVEKIYQAVTDMFNDRYSEKNQINSKYNTFTKPTTETPITPTPQPKRKPTSRLNKEGDGSEVYDLPISSDVKIQLENDSATIYAPELGAAKQNAIVAYVKGKALNKLFTTEDTNRAEVFSTIKKEYEDMIESANLELIEFADDAEAIEDIQAYKKSVGDVLNNWGIIESTVVEQIARINNTSIDLEDSEAEITLDENQLEGERFGENRSFTMDARNKLSAKVKRLFGAINKINLNGSITTNYLGQEVVMPFDKVYNTLQALTANQDPDFNILMKVLEDNVKAFPWLTQVIKVLKDSEEDVKNQFVTGMTNHKHNMKFVMWSKDKDGNYRMVQYDADSNELAQRVVSDWTTKYLQSELFIQQFNPKTQEYYRVKNPEGFDNFMEAMAGWIKSPDSFTNQELVTWLNTIGIEVPIEAIEYMRESKVRRLTFAQQFTTKNGIFRIIYDNLSKLEANTDVADDSVLITKDNSIKDLSKVVTKFKEVLASNSFRAGTKSVYSYGNTKFLVNQMRRLVQKNKSTYKGKEVYTNGLLTELGSTSFTRNSYLLKGGVNDKGNAIDGALYTENGQFVKADNGEFIINEDSPLLDNLGYATASLEPLKEMGAKSRDNSEMNNLSPMAIEIFKLANLHADQADNSGTNNRVITVNYPTTSDKTTVMLVRALAFHIGYDVDGNITDDTLDRLYDLLVLPELERIMTFKALAATNNTPDIKGYRGGADKFLLLPILNSIPELFDSNINQTEEVRVKVKQVLKEEYLDKLIADKLNFWNKVGIGTTNIDKKNPSNTVKHKFLYTKSKVFKGVEESNYSKVAATDMVIQYLVANAESFKNFIGDPAIYWKPDRNSQTITEQVEDTFNNIGKRLAADIAPGTEIADATNNNYIQIFANDKVSQSKEYNNRLKKILSNDDRRAYGKGNGLKGFDATDAQEYTTWREHLYILKQQGLINQKDFDLATETLAAGKKLSYEMLGRVLQPLKPVYVGNALLKGKDVINRYYIKSSSFPLIPQLTKGLELDKVRIAMERLEDSEQKTVRLAYSTAVKVGNVTNPVTLWNEDGTAVDNIDFTGAYVSLNRSGFRIQQDVPYDPSKSSIREVTQASKNLFINMGEVTGFKVPWLEGEYTGTQLQQVYNDLHRELYKLGKQELMDKLVVDGQVNIQELKKMVKEESIKRGYSLSDRLLIDLDDNLEFLPFSSIADKYSAVLNALVYDRVLKQKIYGKSFVLGSAEGFITDKNAQDTYIKETPGIIFTDTWDGNVNTTSENGDDTIKPAQVLVPWKFKDNKGNKLDINAFINKETGRIDFSRLPQDILKGFGMRIPNQGPNSQIAFEIVGFLPETSGDLIIAPEDLIVQMGSDFDVDKLYTYMYNTFFKGGYLYKNFPEGEELVQLQRKLETLISTYQLEISLIKLENASLKSSIDDLFNSFKILGSKKLTISKKDREQLRSFEEDELTELVMAIERNKDLKETVKAGLNEIIGLYNVLKHSEKYSLQNKILDIHIAVHSNNNVKVQEQIAKPLDSWILEKEAKNIDNARRERNPKATPFTGLSDNYQLTKFLNATAGKKGVGIFSLDSMFNAVAQTTSKLKYKSTKKDKFEVRFGHNISYGDLNRIECLDDKSTYISTVIAGYQSGAVDNEKLQVLDKLNINAETFGVIKLLNQLGFSNTTVYFIAQDIVFDYIEELKRLKGSVGEYVANAEETAVKNVLAKYPAEDSDIDFDKEMTPATLKSMIKWDKDSEGNFVEPTNYKAFQRAILAKFLYIKDKSDSLSSIQTTINVDSKGFGKSIIESNLREENFWKLLDSPIEGATNLIGDVKKISLSQVDEMKANGYIVRVNPFDKGLYAIKSTTIPGMAIVEGLFTNNDLWNGVYPTSLDGVANTFLEAEKLLGLEDKSFGSKSALRYDVWNSLKSYLFTNPNNIINNVTDRRKDLLIDVVERATDFDETGIKYETVNVIHQSLATIVSKIKDLKMLQSNSFIQRLEVELNSNGKPSLVIFNSSARENLDESQLYTDFLDLFIRNRSLGIFNGVEYDTNQLAQELVEYSYLNGGIQEALQFIKYISPSYLKSTGFMGTVVNTNLNSPETIGLGLPVESVPYWYVSPFMTQYIQHNPGKIKARLNNMSELESTKDGYVLNEEGSRLYITIYTSEGAEQVPPPFLSLYDNNVKNDKKFRIFKYNGNSYDEVAVLGGKAVDEYNFNVANQNSIISPISTTKTQPLVDRRPTVPESSKQFPNEVPLQLSDKLKLVSTSNGKAKVKDMLGVIVEESGYYGTLASLYTDLLNDLPNFELEVMKESVKFGSWNGSTLRLNRQAINKGTPQQGYRGILHEITHILTVSILNNPDKANAQQRKAIAKLNNIFNQYVELVKQDPDYAEYKKRLEAYKKAVKEGKGSEEWNSYFTDDTLRISEEDKAKFYPAENVKEFVAQAMADVEFQKILNSIMDKNSDTQSIWQQLKDIVRRLIESIVDFNIDKNSLLASTLTNVMDLFGEEVVNTPTSTDTINIYAGTNENADLSNFAIRPFTFKDPNGEEDFNFKSVEQGFQFFKTYYTDAQHPDIVFELGKIQDKILNTTNGAELKRLGNSYPTFNSKKWDKDSSKIMKLMLLRSFQDNPKALEKLLATGDAELTHTQDKGRWGTEFPRLLMEVREELRGAITETINTVTKIIPITNIFDRNSVQKDSEFIYLFTDNAQRTSGNNLISDNSRYSNIYGKGKKYPTMTQAVIRGLNNAFPITTMVDDKRTQWTDDRFDEYKEIIDDEIGEIKAALNVYKGLKFSAQTPFGKGKISNMKQTAPKIWDYLNKKLLEIGIDNTEEKPIVAQQFIQTTETSPVTTEETFNQYGTTYTFTLENGIITNATYKQGYGEELPMNKKNWYNKYEELKTIEQGVKTTPKIVEPVAATPLNTFTFKDGTVIETGFKLNTQQEEALQLMADFYNDGKPFFTLKGYAGTGKAQPLTAKIYTPDGYKLMGDIKVNDLVLNEFGQPIRVTGVFPQGSKSLCRVNFSDGHSVECCDEHLWKVFSYKDRACNRTSRYKHRNKIKYSILTTKEISESIRIDKNRNDLNYQIPVLSYPATFTKKKLDINPYLLGVLIGDGGLTSSIKFSTKDSFILEKIEGIVKTYGLYVEKIGTSLKSCDYSITSKKRIKGSNFISTAIKNLGLNCKSECKFIPHDYLYSSIEDRISLLNGLMDTDGTVDKKGYSISYSTSSLTLATNVSELAQSLGCVTTIHSKKTSRLLSYIVNINQNNQFPIFSLPRKQNLVKDKTKYKTVRYITSVDFLGTTQQQCIMVDSPTHLYVTDNFTITHNTSIIKFLVDYINRKEMFSNIVFSSPTHRANAVLKQSLKGQKVLTLHSVFGLSPEQDLEEFDAATAKFIQQNDPVMRRGGMLVIDESSMVNNDLYDFITQASKSMGIKVIFMGDPAQIKPVSQETISKVFTNVTDNYELTKVERTGDNPLLAEITNIRNTKSNEPFSLTSKENNSGEGVDFTNDLNNFFTKAVKVFTSPEFKTNKLLTRVVSGTNSRVSEVNKLIRKGIFGDKAATSEYLEGDIIMGYDNFDLDYRTKEAKIINSGDYVILEASLIKTGVWGNQEVQYYTLRIQDIIDNKKQPVVVNMLSNITPKEVYEELGKEYERLRIFAAQQPKKTPAAARAWAALSAFKSQYGTPQPISYKGNLKIKKTLDYGYTHTIHKSQGGTYKYIFVDSRDIAKFPDTELQRQLKYVAVSRAQTHAYILTNKELNNVANNVDRFGKEFDTDVDEIVEEFLPNTIPSNNIIEELIKRCK